ncbi:MAG TPA: hypothetical protein VHX61_05930 [Rhizomicrobium sp.]|jgi:hypothetical protein|nr:hypothetical protein [Rhizomicrobium sp.]
MANPQHEPTMEEILASIRKIISEDSSAPASTPAAAASEHRTDEPAVLDLTQVVAEENSHSFPTAAAKESCAPQDETANTPTDHTDAPETSEPHSAEEPAHSPAGEGLFSDKTRQALSETMAGLNAPAPAEAAPELASEPAVPPVGVSVEAVFERAVRESFTPVLQNWLSDNTGTLVERMTPTIRDWLDEHFPPMLEEAVRAELARAAKTRARR